MSVTLLDKWKLAQAIVADPDLAASPKVSALALLEFLNTGTRQCNPTYERLAEAMGIKRRAAIDAVAALAARGWVTIDRPPRGKRESCSFRFDFDRASQVQKSAPDQVQETTPENGSQVQSTTLDQVQDTTLDQVQSTAPKPSYIETGKEKPVKEVSPPTPSAAKSKARQKAEADPGFDAFIDAYPRKDDKEDARRAYGRVIRNGLATPEQLLAAAKRYAAERAGQDPKFTKHAATWLNKGSFNNKPAEPSRSPPSRPNAGQDTLAAILGTRTGQRPAAQPKTKPDITEAEWTEVQPARRIQS